MHFGMVSAEFTCLHLALMLREHLYSTYSVLPVLIFAVAPVGE